MLNIILNLISSIGIEPIFLLSNELLELSPNTLTESWAVIISILSFDLN